MPPPRSMCAISRQAEPVRRLLRFCVALTVVAVAVVGFASVAQARRRHHHKPKPCTVNGARVVGQTNDKSIRFLTRTQPADDSHDYDRETQYACMPRAWPTGRLHGAGNTADRRRGVVT